MIKIFSSIKTILLKILLIFLGVSVIFAIIIGIYMFKVYMEFLSNKDSIFSKIETFSKELSKSNESSITLGQDKNNKIKFTYIYDRNKKVIAKYSPQKHQLIPLREIPYFVSEGFILVEDQRFYKHIGINFGRLAIAIIKNIITLGKAPGGSTISQQISKILFTKSERSIKRKIYELYCTFEIERRFTKNEILQIYLNSIYLGHGVYGIENASKFYFGKDAGELNIAEAALLIGMNRAPEIYSPIKNKKKAEYIQNVVLNQFVKAKFLSKSDKIFEYKRFWKLFDALGKTGNQSFWKTEVNKSGYITEYIRQILAKEFTYDEITHNGIIVETTIDLEKQRLAESLISQWLDYIKSRIKKISKKRNLKGYDDNKLEKLESAFVSIDYKKQEILSLVGGSNYSFANQLNRAVYSYRPIGSAVKPFIYSKALDQKKIGEMNFQPFTKFKDDLYTYHINGKKYTPKNYHLNHKYGNFVTIYDALRKSLNTISVAVLNKMDKKSVANLIRESAFLHSSKEKKRVPEVLSLALGTCELSPLELATAYAIFPRYGKTMYPKMIRRISDYTGYVYYDSERKNNSHFDFLQPKEPFEPKQIIHSEVAYEITEILKGVFDKGGTGTWPAYVTGLSIPAYAKSGTTQDFKDGWFVGYTNREVSAVWVGMDDNTSILLPGAGTAGLIWCDYNNRVSSGFSPPLSIPKNMKLTTIDMQTGLTAVKACPVVKNFYLWKDGPIPEKCYIHEYKETQSDDEDIIE